MSRDYILRAQSRHARGEAPQFVQRAMTWAKATNEIAGLIRGILADGVVSESEAVYLRTWMRERPDVLNDPLVNSLARRVDRIFEDGIVTPEELEELKSVLIQFVPGSEAPTTLPLDSPEPDIVFLNKSFCFTGTFVSGKRSWCEEQTEMRGGKSVSAVSGSLHYLIIGSKVSGAWINQSYGRKIEEGVRLKQAGAKLSILCEDHWLSFLNTDLPN